MRRLGELVLNRPIYRLGLILLFSFLPFLGWVSTVMIGLVTLQKGWKTGFLVFILPAIPSLIVYFFSPFDKLILFNLLLINFLTWVFAVVLQYFFSWVWVLQALSLVSVGIILLLHLMYPDLQVRLAKHMLVALQEFKFVLSGIDTISFQKWAEQVSIFVMGLQVAMAALTALVCLGLARAWQGILFYSDKLRDELRAIRLSKSFIIMSLLLLGVALFTKHLVLLDLIPVLMLPFLFSSLSLVHYIREAKQLSGVWLVVFYMLVFFLFPYILMLSIILSTGDSFLNFRNLMRS